MFAHHDIVVKNKGGGDQARLDAANASVHSVGFMGIAFYHKLMRDTFAAI